LEFFVANVSIISFELLLVPSKVLGSLANAAKEKAHKTFKANMVAWNCVVRNALDLSSEFH